MRTTNIDELTINKMLKMYKEQNYTAQETANILGLSAAIVLYYVKKSEGGTRKYKDNYRGGGYAEKKRKFTDEQEHTIAEDYYLNGLSATQIMEKYNAHPMQIQRVRRRYASEFGTKKLGCYANKK